MIIGSYYKSELKFKGQAHRSGNTEGKLRNNQGTCGPTASNPMIVIIPAVILRSPSIYLLQVTRIYLSRLVGFAMLYL